MSATPRKHEPTYRLGNASSVRILSATTQKVNAYKTSGQLRTCWQRYLVDTVGCNDMATWGVTGTASGLQDDALLLHHRVLASSMQHTYMLGGLMESKATCTYPRSGRRHTYSCDHAEERWSSHVVSLFLPTLHPRRALSVKAQVISTSSSTKRQQRPGLQRSKSKQHSRSNHSCWNIRHCTQRF